MYLRAGVLSLGLLILSRVLGLLRESVQAAAFGASAWGDAVIVMFTLPDLLVSVLVSGALSYVLLPIWAEGSKADLQASQRKVASGLLAIGLAMGLAVWVFRELIGKALAPGLTGGMKQLAATSLGWSAAVLPMAMLAALWATRLQHERDFVAMYAGNLLVNVLLVAGLAVVAFHGIATFTSETMLLLGGALVLAMLARLAWLYWRLPSAEVAAAPVPVLERRVSPLPAASVWLWAALSSGLLLLIPLIGRSLASRSGEGALASFNYAWKLIELPLVLAIQLVASIAFPAIAGAVAGSAERSRAMHTALALAWALACAAAAVVASFSLPLAQLLFGWGRMSSHDLQLIAQWSAAGVWSLLPQAIIAVVLTVTAASRQMHVAVWAYATGIGLLLIGGWLGLADGLQVMWAVNAVLSGVAATLIVSQRRDIAKGFSPIAMAAPLATCVLLVWASSFMPVLALPGSALVAAIFTALVLGVAAASDPALRAVARRRQPAEKRFMDTPA